MARDPGWHGACDPSTRVCACNAGYALVNPATCYAESALASKAPPILELPAWAYYVGLASLLPLFVDRHGVRALFDIVTDISKDIAGAVAIGDGVAAQWRSRAIAVSCIGGRCERQ
mgnify:CR=1 FL=1